MTYDLRLTTEKQGIALILTIIVMALLLFLGMYFMSFALTDYKIATSHAYAMRDYYLSEAGLHEMFYKLKNDETYKDNFETDESWTAEFTRLNPFGEDSGSYTVSIANSDFAYGEINSAGTIEASQRIVKTTAFKAIGSLTGDGAVFSGGSSENISISGSVINVYNGNLFSNNNLNINWLSDINVYDDTDTSELEGKALAGGNIDVSWSSNLDATARCGKNECTGDCAEQGCPAESIPMPMIDFDSEDKNSYKNKATTTEAASGCDVLCNGVQCETKCVYTKSEFEDLLWQVNEDGTLTLNNEITYVTGDISLKGGRRIVVNGILAVDGTTNIGERYCWTNKGAKDCGFNQITINDPGVGIPSGLLSKDKINFGLYSSFQNIEITGLIYANDEIKLTSVPGSFQVTGAILARKLNITSAWSSFNIYLDNSIILEGIWGGPQPPGEEKPPYSPTITVEHWEEEY